VVAIYPDGSGVHLGTGLFHGNGVARIAFAAILPAFPTHGAKLEWAQALITADGVRHAPNFSPAIAQWLWVVTVLVGLMVMLPSQMSIVDDFSRRWTDIIWSGNKRVRETLAGNQVKRIYYAILGSYVLWSVFCAYLFNTYGTPKLMTS